MGVLQELSDADFEKVSKGDLSPLTDDQLHRLEKEVAPAAPAPEPKVLRGEAHPAISTMDRALLENFATPEKKLEFIHANYPELHAKPDPEHPDGVLLRAPNETDWRALAPKVSESFHPFDHPLGTLKELGHKLLDTSADMAVGAGSGLAATGGALLGGSAGGVPGAYYGASTAGGTGAAGGEALKEKLAQYLGLRDEGVSGGDVAAAGVGGAAAPLLFGAGGQAKGAIPELWGAVKSKVLPGLGEFFSGVPARALKTTGEDFRGVAALDSPEAKLAAVRGLTSQVKGATTGAARAAADALNQPVAAAEAAGKAISLEPVRAPLEDYEAKLLAQIQKTPLDQNLARGLAETRKILQEYGLRAPPAPPPSEEEAAIRALAEHFGEPLEETAAGDPEFINPDNAQSLKQRLTNLADAHKGFTASPGDSIHDIGLRNAVKEAARALDEGIAVATEGGSSAGNAAYSGVKKDQKFLSTIFGKNFDADPNVVTGRLGNLPNESRAVSAARAGAVDSRYATKIMPTAEKLSASKYMGNPSFLPISSKGTTSTSRTLGELLPFGTGKAIGAALSPLTGPWAQKNLMMRPYAATEVLRKALMDPQVLYRILSANGAFGGMGQAGISAGQSAFDKLQQYIGGEK